MKTTQEFLAEKELELASAARELEALRIVAPLLLDEEDRVGITRPKILLVERTDGTPNAMRESLEKENCEVDSTGTIAEGISRILAQQFDVLIIDLNTRAEDNPTLVNALRTFQPACLLVAVSDSLTMQQVARATSLQVDFIVRRSNIKEVAEIVLARATETNPSLLDSEESVACESN